MPTSVSCPKSRFSISTSTLIHFPFLRKTENIIIVMVLILTEIITTTRHCFVSYILNKESHPVAKIFFLTAFLYCLDVSACSQKQLHAKTFETKEKEERKEDIINQICWGSGNLFCNWIALPLENLINVGFIPNIWQVMIIIPYVTLPGSMPWEPNLHLASEYLSF